MINLETNYKVVVTPDQSREIQSLVFALGGYWYSSAGVGNNARRVDNTQHVCLFVGRDLTLTYSGGSEVTDYFRMHSNTLISASNLVHKLRGLLRDKLSEFKPSDKVYIPSISDKIHTLRRVSSDSSNLSAIIDDTYYEFNCYGRSVGVEWLPTRVPVIFHATQDNYERLSNLYPNVLFAQPPSSPPNKEIIQSLLYMGWLAVPCYVSDTHEVEVGQDNRLELVTAVRDNIDAFQTNSTSYMYATPVDLATGLVITGFENGELQLGEPLNL